LTEEFRIWTSRLWSNFRQAHNRSPENAEWHTLVLEARESPGDPLCVSAGESMEAMIQESFRNFDIREVMVDELRRKFRDACTNTQNRKYVDGSF